MKKKKKRQGVGHEARENVLHASHEISDVKKDTQAVEHGAAWLDLNKENVDKGNLDVRKKNDKRITWDLSHGLR